MDGWLGPGGWYNVCVCCESVFIVDMAEYVYCRYLRILGAPSVQSCSTLSISAC